MTREEIEARLVVAEATNRVLYAALHTAVALSQQSSLRVTRSIEEYRS